MERKIPFDLLFTCAHEILSLPKEKGFSLKYLGDIGNVIVTHLNFPLIVQVRKSLQSLTAGKMNLKYFTRIRINLRAFYMFYTHFRIIFR